MAAKEASTHAVFPQVVRGPDLDRRAVLYARLVHERSCLDLPPAAIENGILRRTAQAHHGRIGIRRKVPTTDGDNEIIPGKLGHAAAAIDIASP